MLFSVIIPAYNEERYLGATLRSILDAGDHLQDVRPSDTFEVIVVVWRIIGHLTNMAQGATQFCRTVEFVELGGYDETIFMGEDCDFYWRMSRCAKKTSRHTAFINEVRVVPSPRRYDQWTIWKTLVNTSPLFILLNWKRKSAWSGWYEDRPE